MKNLLLLVVICLLNLSCENNYEPTGLIRPLNSKANIEIYDSIPSYYKEGDTIYAYHDSNICSYYHALDYHNKIKKKEFAILKKRY